MSNTSVFKRLFAASPIVIAVALLPIQRAAAEAADDDPVAKITQLNRDAIGAYQSRKFEEARKLLKQALDLAAASGLDTHPIKARTHVHMGVVIIGGFKQRDVGIKQFKKGLEIQPEIKLTKALITPELESAFDQAAAEMKGGPAAASADSTPEPTPAAPAADSSSGGLIHEAVKEGKQGSAISISVGVQSDVKFAKMVLAYRADGTGEFLGREMKHVTEGTYAAEIPTTATVGRSVAYYIEAEDADGGLVASRGSADNPMVISLGETRAAAVARAGDEDEGEEEEEEEGAGKRGKIFVALMVGSGAGWAAGNGDTNADIMIKPAGFAMAQLGQFAPEVGYWLRQNFMLSLQGRFQAIGGLGGSVAGPTDLKLPPGSQSCPPPATSGCVKHTANYAAAAFVKATWAFGKNKFRPFFSFAAGGGQIRHVVTFKTLKDYCGGPMVPCVDTISAGPVVVGPGAGFMANLTESFGFVGQLNTQLAFPNFTANFDANLGVALQF